MRLSKQSKDYLDLLFSMFYQHHKDRQRLLHKILSYEKPDNPPAYLMYLYDSAKKLERDAFIMIRNTYERL